MCHLSQVGTRATSFRRVRSEPLLRSHVGLAVQEFLYSAVYNAHLFAQIFEEKNKDVHYTWVVLILYLYKCF